MQEMFGLLGTILLMLYIIKNLCYAFHRLAVFLIVHRQNFGGQKSQRVVLPNKLCCDVQACWCWCCEVLTQSNRLEEIRWTLRCLWFPPWLIVHPCWLGWSRWQSQTLWDAEALRAVLLYCLKSNERLSLICRLLFSVEKKRRAWFCGVKITWFLLEAALSLFLCHWSTCTSELFQGRLYCIVFSKWCVQGAHK